MTGGIVALALHLVVTGLLSCWPLVVETCPGGALMYGWKTEVIAEEGRRRARTHGEWYQLNTVLFVPAPCGYSSVRVQM